MNKKFMEEAKILGWRVDEYAGWVRFVMNFKDPNELRSGKIVLMATKENFEIDMRTVLTTDVCENIIRKWVVDAWERWKDLEKNSSFYKYDAAQAEIGRGEKFFREKVVQLKLKMFDLEENTSTII